MLDPEDAKLFECFPLVFVPSGVLSRSFQLFSDSSKGSVEGRMLLAASEAEFDFVVEKYRESVNGL